MIGNGLMTYGQSRSVPIDSEQVNANQSQGRRDLRVRIDQWSMKDVRATNVRWEKVCQLYEFTWK